MLFDDSGERLEEDDDIAKEGPVVHVGAIELDAAFVAGAATTGDLARGQ